MLLSLISCNNNDSGDDIDPTVIPPATGIPTPQNISYTIIGQYPHDTSAYTQGLEFHNGKLLESTGDYQNSSIRITDPRTGTVEKKHVMGTREIFGEGITVLNGKLYQLTWENNLAYVYDVKDISRPEKTFKWPYQGWGITNNGSDLIISDGSANLYFVDPSNFTVRNTLAVRSNRGAVNQLNELEFIEGYVYANVYTTNDIVKIDPETGFVVGRMSFDNLLQRNEYIPGHTDVFNGIAWDSTKRTMMVTGKRWPKMYEVRIN